MDNEDQPLLTEFGIQDFDAEMQAALLADYYETLNLRLSMALESRLTDEQLETFDTLHDAGDDEATLSWLRATISDYDTVIATETASVKADIAASLSKYRPNA